MLAASLAALWLLTSLFALAACPGQSVGGADAAAVVSAGGMPECGCAGCCCGGGDGADDRGVARSERLCADAAAQAHPALLPVTQVANGDRASAHAEAAMPVQFDPSPSPRALKRTEAPPPGPWLPSVTATGLRSPPAA